MKTARLTVEEVNAFKPSFYNPLEVECDNGGYKDCYKRIKIISPCIGSRVLIINNNGGADDLSVTNLDAFPSQKPEPKIETLYECINSCGGCEYRFDDNSWPNFAYKLKQGSSSVERRTGRTLKLNMDTWEIVHG